MSRRRHSSMTFASVLGYATLALVAHLGAACGGPPVAPQSPAMVTADPAPAPTKAAAPKTSTERDYWKGRTDLIKPPAVQPARPLALPQIQRSALRNGLRVLVLPDKTLPLVDVQLLVRVGSIDDRPDRVGLADFVAQMLRQGTKAMDADTLSETVDAAGVSLGAHAGYEGTWVSCNGRTRSLDLCLRLVADLAQRPTFPEKEMGEIRDRLLTTVKQTRDNPGSLAAAHFDNLLYGDGHPGGRPLSEQSVKAITRGDLQGFHQQRYVPGAAILGISGNVDPRTLRRLIRKHFGRWRRRPVPQRSIVPVSDPKEGLRVLLVDKPDLTQAFFALGHAGIKLTHPDRDAVTVMNYVLGGGGFSSRLMDVLRAQGGKTYGIHSRFTREEHDGAFVVQSFTKNDQLVTALRLVQGELSRLRSAPPTTKEIQAAKGKIAGGYALRFRTPAGLVQRLLATQVMGLPDTRVTELPVRIDRLTPEQVAVAARRHLRPTQLVAAVVGRAAVVAPALRKAGIPFQQIDYLAPISAKARAAR